ncbi:pre-rRNA-processing protein esf1 [Candidozyma auris]
MAKKEKSKKQSSALNDPRFALAQTDARFQLPSLKRNKVKVDDRFSKEELKKLNVTATGRKVKVDRYGRPVRDDSNKDFDKYFEEENASESGSEASSESEESSDFDDSESEEEVMAKKKTPKSIVKQPKNTKGDAEEESSGSDTAVEDEPGFVDKARGEGLSSSSDEDSDSDEELEDEESEIELEEEKPEEGDPTSTFAVVNMDWDNIRAVDLMATFVSFVPKGGSIKLVTIYPSEYGKEQMQKEEVEGPPKELFAKKKKKVESDSDSDSEEELDLKNADDLEKAARKIYEEDDGEEDYDSKALRRYQLQRLRYYYAVVRCDSVATAKNIYDNCDGSEYESTANTFDLRYVPEDMDFDDQDVKDQCDKIPASYRPDSTFVTDALQHSKVKLTWDQTPKERTTLSSRSFSQKEIDDMDFKAYLASDTDDSEAEQAESLKDKYKNLLGGKFSFDKGKEDDEDDVDMEITFNPGLDETKADKVPEEPTEETTIDAYKRKEKERRARRLEKFKEKQSENEAEKEDKLGKKDKKGKKDRKKKSAQDVDEKSKAELELLLMDEDNETAKQDHFDMRDIVKAEKDRKKKKKKNKGKKYDEDMIQDSFTPDLNDDRFKEVFESHDYAIDPTSSEFKKTELMKKILDERSKRSRREGEDDRHAKKAKRSKASVSSNDNSSELNNLVKKLKNKKH